MAAGFEIISVGITNSQEGWYEYLLEVEDESGNVGKESMLVYVNPPMVKASDDIVYSEGTTGHQLVWIIRDDKFCNYSIYCNDSLIESGNLTTPTLSISVDGLALGTYEYRLELCNELGHLSNYSIFVSVIDTTVPTIIPLSDCEFVVGAINATLVWQVFDLHPGTYFITESGQLIQEEKMWNNDEITLNLTGWSAGSYNIALFVMDTSGNTAVDNVQVTIVPEEVTTPTFSEQAQTITPKSIILICLVVVGLLFSVVAVLTIRRQQKYLISNDKKD